MWELVEQSPPLHVKKMSALRSPTDLIEDSCCIFRSNVLSHQVELIQIITHRIFLYKSVFCNPVPNVNLVLELHYSFYLDG